MNRKMIAIVMMMGLLVPALAAGADEKAVKEGKAPKETGIEVIVIPDAKSGVDVIREIRLDELSGAREVFSVGAKGEAAADRPKGKPGPDVNALRDALCLQREFVELMGDPLLSAQLAITRIKDMALAGKQAELGAKMLQDIAAKADHVGIRRSALFALSELHEKSGNPAGAIEVMAQVAKVPQAPPRPQPAGADATATEARRVNRWLHEHPDLAERIIAGFRAQRPAPSSPRSQAMPMPGAPVGQPGRMAPGRGAMPMPGSPTGQPGRMMPGRGAAPMPMPGRGVAPPRGMMPGPAQRGMMQGRGMAMRAPAVAPRGMMPGWGAVAPSPARRGDRWAPRGPEARMGDRREPTARDARRRPDPRGDMDRRDRGPRDMDRRDEGRADRDRGDRRPRDEAERPDRDRPARDRDRPMERSERREADAPRMSVLPEGVRVYVYGEGKGASEMPFGVRRLGEGQREFRIEVRPAPQGQRPEVQVRPLPEGQAQGRGWIQVRPSGEGLARDQAVRRAPEAEGRAREAAPREPEPRARPRDEAAGRPGPEVRRELLPVRPSPEGRRPDVQEDRLRALMQRIERQARELDEKAKMLEARVKELNRWEEQLKRQAEELRRDEQPRTDRRERSERRERRDEDEDDED